MIDPIEHKSLVIILSSRDDVNPIRTSLSLLRMAIDSGQICADQVQLLVMTDSRPRPELVAAVRESAVSATFMHLSPIRLLMHRAIYLFAYRLRVPLFTSMLSRHRSLLSSYLPKVRKALKYARKNRYEVVVKCDDDAVLSPVAWRVLVDDSRDKLSARECILVTPALSSGIPTWVDYADLMLSPEEHSGLLQQLRKVDLPSTCWGVDYTQVIATQSGDVWDENAHQSALSAVEHPYKGFHPIRFSAQACVDLLTVGLRNRARFLQQTSAENVTYRACGDYLCNVVFATTPEKYRQAIGADDRLIDPFDEVPINALVGEEGNYYLVASNAPAIHFLYNSAYGQPVCFEGKIAVSRDLEMQLAASLSRVLQDQSSPARTSDR